MRNTYREYVSAPPKAIKSPIFTDNPFGISELTNSTDCPPGSIPNVTTPTNATRHPAHTKFFTGSPKNVSTNGVNAIDACVKNDTLVASVNNSATLQHPCARKFHVASSNAADQKSLFSLVSPLLFFLNESSSCGTKHNRTMTPLIIPNVPTDGGPALTKTIFKDTHKPP